MKKLFLPFLFVLFVQTNGTLPSVKGVIYHSVSNEKITLTLSNYQHCTSVISCGGFKDSLMIGALFLDGMKNTRVLQVQTYGNDIYGWSDGNVNYQISK